MDRQEKKIPSTEKSVEGLGWRRSRRKIMIDRARCGESTGRSDSLWLAESPAIIKYSFKTTRWNTMNETKERP